MARIEEVGGKAGDRPKVLCLEWLDPLMASGNWIPQLIRAAGGEPVLGQTGLHSPVVTWEEIQRADPDRIILIPCGFSIPRTREEYRRLPAKLLWGELKAVQNQDLYLADGNQFFNRPGPRLVESTEILAEILHPSIFSFGHLGRGWERVGA